MRVLGEGCLLLSFVSTGYAAFLSVAPGPGLGRWRPRMAMSAAVVGLASLSVTLAVLAWALVERDYRFEYVSQYASPLLPRQYCLSALWVGQAGSLLLWTWMMGASALILRLTPAADASVRNTAFGLVMANVCFLVAVMVFAADPMAPSLTAGAEGRGLSPLLQHPSMLVHPPIVFASYAAWAVPCSVALAALGGGRVDAGWIQLARPWAVAAWTLLGAGLLLGAHWAYQELGWGGYWGWDPVENGSLLPWLTGTGCIHAMLAWRHRGCLKMTALALAVVTLALCNFATFLTRSGIFSSVHAFSESPIGWMFLGLMIALVAGGAVLVVRRRSLLVSERSFHCLSGRESLICVSVFLLLLLAAVVLAGTLVAPLSKVFAGRVIQVGPELYNNVLPPLGLAVLAMTAAVPLLRWGAPPSRTQRGLLAGCLALAVVVAMWAFAFGVRHPLAIAVIGLAGLAALAPVAAVLHDAWRREAPTWWQGIVSALRNGRRQYAAYWIHVGLLFVAVGVAGSSLGKKQQEVNLAEGDTIQWEGRQIQYVQLEQSQLADKLVAEAVLNVARKGDDPVTLRPARHLHLLQDQWTTEVAIDSRWSGDFYTILHAGLGDGRVSLTLVNNPMIRWIWAGGMLCAASAVVAVLPSRRRRVGTMLSIEARSECETGRPVSDAA
jgi:cytochrome c-type biogenesis protein CcmF